MTVPSGTSLLQGGIDVQHEMQAPHIAQLTCSAMTRSLEATDLPMDMQLRSVMPSSSGWTCCSHTARMLQRRVPCGLQSMKQHSSWGLQACKCC